MDAVVGVFDVEGNLISSTRLFASNMTLHDLNRMRDAILELLCTDAGSGSVQANGKQVLLHALSGLVPGCLAVVRATWSQTAPLTPRQREIAEYAAYGASAAEIAALLGISKNTVRQHLKDVYRKLEVANRVELSWALGNE